MPTNSAHEKTHGFTLIEVLVVVAVLAVLMAVLLPALQRAHEAARALKEANAARQLMLGYINYAEVHDYKVLQGMWYGAPPAPSGQPVPIPADELVAWDTTGQPLPDDMPLPIKQRYPWRLLPWCDFQLLGTMLVGEQEGFVRFRDQLDPINFYYGVSLMPTFGLNTNFVGGDMTGGAYKFFACDPIIRLTQSVQPSGQLVFCTAHNKQFYGDFSQWDISTGFHRVTLPVTDEYNPDIDSSQFGYIFPRWSGKATVGFLDGHVELLNEAELTDSRIWSNIARRLNDPDWKLEE